MQDINDVEVVEVKVSGDGEVLWVNGYGIRVLVNLPERMINIIDDRECESEYISDDEAIIVANSMIKYGGGFERRLGYALLYAGSINARIIKDSFPEYWLRYKNFAKRDADING